MADVIYICDSTGQATFAYPSIGLVQTTDCRNGTGRWVSAASYTDARIAAYLAANPPSSSGTSSFADTRITTQQMSDLLSAALLVLCVAYAVRQITNALRGKR